MRVRMDEDTEYLKLPLEERMVHKLWKARVSGYEEAKKLFGQVTSNFPFLFCSLVDPDPHGSAFIWLSWIRTFNGNRDPDPDPGT